MELIKPPPNRLIVKPCLSGLMITVGSEQFGIFNFSLVMKPNGDIDRYQLKLFWREIRAKVASLPTGRRQCDLWESLERRIPITTLSDEEIRNKIYGFTNDFQRDAATRMAKAA